ncbi:MAG: hypothetical protein LBU99_02435 [Spirochaetaceae bacterium]|jgi:hypothetical protein|nr:hypothetical protein [Spirochaetaceae bacterium]
MKRFFSSILVLSVLTLSGYGADLESLIGAERRDILLNGRSIAETQLKKPAPLLVPNLTEVQNLIQSVQDSFEPNIMVESLYLYKKPAKASKSGWTEAERTAVYNRLLGLSSLKGIQYYSSSRKTMRTFYETSTIIDDPEGKIPLSDPRYQIPPKEVILYARQKDLTFGDNIYKYTYLTEREYMIFIQENLTAMNAGIIPAIGKNKLHSTAVIIDAGEQFLIYMVSMADTAVLPGISKRVSSSFSTRADAIVQWLIDQLDRAFT